MLEETNKNTGGIWAMNLENFKKHIRILDNEEATRYRNLYIKKYVDSYTHAKCYQERIEQLHTFSDGLCYEGYLWDFLKSETYIEETQLEEYRKFLKQVLIFWDNHSKDRIFIKKYWKFGKKDMIELDFNLLLDHLEFFPEDIYITNKALTWTIVLTHEEEPLGKRLIIKDGAI